eukprot:SM000144S00669  [mRNA]  locus=s144:123070:125298:+ [translate_table: standard]
MGPPQHGSSAALGDGAHCSRTSRPGGRARSAALVLTAVFCTWSFRMEQSAAAQVWSDAGITNGKAGARSTLETPAPASSPPTYRGIIYQGGPILSGPVLDVYLVWYGTWPSEADKSVIRNLIRSLDYNTNSNQQGSTLQKWWNVAHIYTDSTGAMVSNNISLTGEGVDSYSYGRYLYVNLDNQTLPDIKDILNNQVDNGYLPADVNGVYFLITSADVFVLDATDSNGGLCGPGTRGYCSQHTMESYLATDFITTTSLKYAVLGDPSQCPEQCIPFQQANPSAQAPNGNWAIDGLANNVAAALVNSATNPSGISGGPPGWVSNLTATIQEEVASKCSHSFGTLAVNGSVEYNLMGTGGQR